MKYLYWYRCVICACELTCICGLLRGLFIVGHYMVKTNEVDVAVGCNLAYMCKNVGSMPIYHNGCVAHTCNVAAIFV